MDFVQEIHPGVFLLDTNHFGQPGLGGAYIIHAEEVALVDTGASLAKERILLGLKALGIERTKVKWIFLTHVHLDHAGGAGAVISALPNATVVVHPRGAKHLVDPSKLVASTKSATGERFRFYGEAFPIPEERICTGTDGEVFPLGSLKVLAIDSPGHAPHHLCFFIPEHGLLFTGDALGLYIKGRLLPTTVPPSFDLVAWLATLERLASLKPQKLLFAHFGPGEPKLIEEYRALLLAWVERVRRHQEKPEEEAISAVLSELRREGWPVGPGVSGDWAMSVRGVLQYLHRKEASG
ncbi:MAG: MBL fold metallo-hydrolase [Candidatus Bipolaricaulota bacterium]|nr:MBL fold metallo-hydrolase [Candidatus Bipolaricaulota bacterium]MDW8126756.1 MBL fold metallo-hydrolase [Candidatus Bipolaricaulota bacterium]